MENIIHIDISFHNNNNSNSVFIYSRYRKIPKISPRAYIFQRPFLRSLSTEGNLRFKIDWASLTVGSKFTAFALFYFVFEGNFPSTSPRGAYIWRGDLTEGFLRYKFWGLCYFFGGAYFQNFTVSLPLRSAQIPKKKMTKKKFFFWRGGRLS